MTWSVFSKNRYWMQAWITDWLVLYLIEFMWVDHKPPSLQGAMDDRETRFSMECWYPPGHFYKGVAWLVLLVIRSLSFFKCMFAYVNNIDECAMNCWWDFDPTLSYTGRKSSQPLLISMANKALKHETKERLQTGFRTLKPLDCILRTTFAPWWRICFS